MPKRVAVIHGPNLNMLGKREIGIYGGQSMDDINADVENEAESLGVDVEFYQSNSEGELCSYIQGCRNRGGRNCAERRSLYSLFNRSSGCNIFRSGSYCGSPYIQYIQA